ncbi:ribonuclease H-like [Ambystoma mexicanum]|uniref:ribonuclease H-like n=1 Tax=Ambystoma mexicanum TaxID=8296 RepID=UPI0037E7BE91
MEAYLTSTHKVYEEDTCQGIPTVKAEGCSYQVDNNGVKELVAGIGNAWVNYTSEPSAGYKIGPRNSQVAELMVVNQVTLTAAHNQFKELVIITDSDYVRNGLVEHLMNWKNQGMLSLNNKPIKHGKLIKSIDDLVTSNEMTIVGALHGDVIETESLLDEIQVPVVTRSQTQQ